MKNVKEEFVNYKEGDTIWLLVDEGQCKALMGDWAVNVDNYQCQLQIARSKKHRGMFVVTTKSLMWANRIIVWIGCKQVTFKTV